MDKRAERRRGWLSGRAGLDWRGDDRPYAALLDALTRDLVSTEAAEMERISTSRRSMAEVRQEQQQAERDELAEARRELDRFRAALEDARTRSGAEGAGEAAYDARDPQRDEQADLLIQYLVRPGYAEVRTEEPQPGAYVYYIRVDWERLRSLASELGQPIPV